MCSILVYERIIEPVDRNSNTLQDLSLLSCEHLDGKAFTAIGNCIEIRFPTLSGANHFKDHHLEKILLNAPHLRSLKVENCELNSTTDGLSHSVKLRLFRDPSSLSCVDPADLAWREAFRCCGELPSAGSVELYSTTDNDELICQIASSQSLRGFRLTKFSAWTRELEGQYPSQSWFG